MVTHCIGSDFTFTLMVSIKERQTCRLLETCVIFWATHVEGVLFVAEVSVPACISACLYKSRTVI